MKISRAAFSVLVKFAGLYEVVREVLQKIDEFTLIDNSKELGLSLITFEDAGIELDPFMKTHLFNSAELAFAT